MTRYDSSVSTDDYRKTALENASGRVKKPGTPKSLRKLAADILVRCLTDDDDDAGVADLIELERLGGLTSLAEAAEFHRISNFLHLRWRDSDGVGRRVADMLTIAYEQSTFSHLRVLAELEAISRILDDHGINWMVIKGPVLAEESYSRFDLRSYADLDLVISAPSFHRAIEALEGENYRLLDNNWRLLASEVKGELHLLSPLGVMVDAHWNLINDSRTRERFSIRSETLFENIRRVDMANVSVPSPSPSEHLVYLATHACLAGGERLIWMKDIQQTVMNEDIDWDRVGELAEEWRVRPLVALMLDRTRRVIGLPASADGNTSFAQSGYWLQLARLADRLSPPQAVTVEGSPSRIIARATRPRPLQSTTELARRSISWARARLGLVRELDQEEAARRGSAYVPTGDSTDREAFFVAVAGPEPRQ